MKLLRILAFVVALLAISYIEVGHAATPKAPAASTTPTVLRWVAPTQNTDGTTLTNLAGFKLYHCLTPWGLAPSIVPNTVCDPAITLAGMVQTYNYTLAVDGDHDFALTAYNSTGQESPKSNDVTVSRASVTVAVTPSSPVMGADTTVYTSVKVKDAYQLLPIGTAPAGTPCIASQTLNGFMAVPVAKVTFTGSVKSTVVLGKCS